MEVFKIDLLARERCEVVSDSKISIKNEENLPITTQNMHINSRKNNRRYLHSNNVLKKKEFFNNEDRDTCAFYKNNHSLFRCKNVTVVNGRLSIVKLFYLS